MKNHITVYLLKILRMLCIEVGTTPNGLNISGIIESKRLTVNALIFGFAFSVLSIFVWCING